MKKQTVIFLIIGILIISVIGLWVIVEPFNDTIEAFTMRPIAEDELPHDAVLMNLTEEDFAAHQSLYECMGKYVHIYERPLDYFKFSGVTSLEGQEIYGKYGGKILFWNGTYYQFLFLTS
ncbi:MAG: hypothetical protein Q7J08_03945 [Methanocorpusculum sp.]|uniref:hypothetical protein n=1 Tax=Methanocorpusculum sp. TaxID=2058474 RepID=UPI002720AFA3|nr:hypothetical protein [Methanocorpusculum sp.]MDO9522848.1 hypothetical protein [Methanocorpusculum sp.]